MRARGKNSLNERQSRNAPHPVDIHVGSRLRERRIVLGMSQQQLAASLGAQFSTGVQIRTGENRISAGRLYDLGKVLGVPVAFFFEDVPDTSTPAAPPASGGHSDPLIGREAAELFAAYRAISDPVVRRRLRQLAKALSVVERFDPTERAFASCRKRRRTTVGVFSRAGAGDRKSVV